MLEFNNVDDLKMFTFFYINEHSRLTKEEKTILFDFAKDATPKQLECLLNTGRMVDVENLSEDHTSGGLIYTSSTSTPQQVWNTSWQGMAAAAAVALALAAGYKIYRDYLSKAARACKGKKGDDLVNCRSEFKKKAQRAKVAALQKSMSKCAKTKDPNACKNKLRAKIAQEKAKMGA